MISTQFLIVLILTILSSCLAGSLSSGEEISSFVTRSIDENAVSDSIEFETVQVNNSHITFDIIYMYPKLGGCVCEELLSLL
jgi:hypothetical protein